MIFAFFSDDEFGIASDEIFDILEFERAKSEINIAYLDKTGAFINVPNMFALLPNQGGINI